jgi:transposase
MARMGLAHQWQEVPVGRPKRINHEYLQRLKELVNKSPQDFGYSFQRWTGSWLSRHLAKELGIEVHERHTNRLLKEMGLSPTKMHKISLMENQLTRIAIGDLASISQSQSN